VFSRLAQNHCILNPSTNTVLYEYMKYYQRCFPCVLFLTFISSTCLQIQGPFKLSTAPEYASQPVSINGTSLSLDAPAVHYAIAGKFGSKVALGVEPFVLSYEVQATEGRTCGGSYLKLVPNVDAFLSDPRSSKYVIMFGPDKCGTTNKVHLILYYQNPITKEWEEKHLSNTPVPKSDTLPHFYSLAIRPDSTYAIYVDGDEEQEGNLLTDFTPSILPPREIEDPTDTKPADWVDEATIPDPDDVKPADWVENEKISDPTAVKPAEWNDEEDGEWEAPVIDNPDYSGPWRQKRIPNPAYKGPFKPRNIPNPAYFDDPTPSKISGQSIDGIAIEVWTMDGHVQYDNFIVGSDEKEVLDLAKKNWEPKFNREKTLADAAAKAEARKEQLKSRKAFDEMTWQEKLVSFVDDIRAVFEENPVNAAISTLVVIVGSIALVALIGSSSSSKAEEVPASNVSAEKKENDADVVEEKTPKQDDGASTESTPRKRTSRKQA
jgi:calnexin